MDQELPDAAAYAPGKFVSTHQMAALFCVK